MPRFSFHCDHGEQQWPACDSARSHNIAVSFDADALSEVLERFEEFLRGCGYCADGTLDFVDEDGEVRPDDSLQEEIAAELSAAVERIVAAARLCGCEVEVVDLDADDNDQDDAGTTDDD